MNPEEQARNLAFVREHGIDEAVIQDPAFPQDPTTWEEWALRRAAQEGITDPDQLQARASSIRMWPYRSASTPKPVPAIDMERGAVGGEGRAPSIHSTRELDAWAQKHGPRNPEPNTLLDAVEKLGEPMRLPDIARAAGMTPRALRQDREQSRLREAKGKPRMANGELAEFPRPYTGEDGAEDATYLPAQVARFLRSKPGKGRRTAAVRPKATE
ncbi:hypothetical protein ABZ234_08085 [Nocardiopsis sp. NPDC006198]|uniref:hypothetical protein n=1 Tax=Nocardiopsis sp. NPDC006198 TaxID=3154472 RepID=UPI0033A4B4E0